MFMYNLIECSDAYSKTSGSLWQQYRDEPALSNSCNVNGFSDYNSNSVAFKCKQKIMGETRDVCTKDAEIVIPLKYPSNFRGAP